jgi:hypothetical protein
MQWVCSASPVRPSTLFAFGLRHISCLFTPLLSSSQQLHPFSTTPLLAPVHANTAHLRALRISSHSLHSLDVSAPCRQHAFRSNYDFFPPLWLPAREKRTRRAALRVEKMGLSLKNYKTLTSSKRH